MPHNIFPLTEKTEYMTGSYKVAELYARQNHSKTSAVISIHSIINNTNPKIFCNEKNKIQDVIFFCFEDIRDNNEEHLVYGISDKDADDIADFALKWINKVDLLIIHCDGGISRSPGVCAGIVKALGGDDSRFFHHYRMSPNIHCYEKTYAAMKKKLAEIQKQGGKIPNANPSSFESFTDKTV